MPRKKRTTTINTTANILPNVAGEAEWVDIASLQPWQDNPRINDAAVPEVAASIARFGWGSPILARREDRMVIAGHTRLKAAISLGMSSALVRWMDISLQEAKALALADNKLSEIADWDDEKLSEVLKELAAEQVSLDNLGFATDEMEALLSDLEVQPDTTYTSKIKAPIYTPKGECPPITSLFDRTKTQSLIAEIDKASLPPDQAAFLRLAAERHTAFNFHDIAEWYCHASADVQRLMENSGLVIIDFNRAIENGFVKLTNRLGELADREEEVSGDEG